MGNHVADVMYADKDWAVDHQVPLDLTHRVEATA